MYLFHDPALEMLNRLQLLRRDDLRLAADYLVKLRQTGPGREAQQSKKTRPRNRRLVEAPLRPVDAKSARTKEKPTSIFSAITDLMHYPQALLSLRQFSPQEKREIYQPGRTPHS